MGRVNPANIPVERSQREMSGRVLLRTFKSRIVRKKPVDENLITLEKVHAILLNCINLTKKQKLEYAESERYFMKSYLKKVNQFTFILV